MRVQASMDAWRRWFVLLLRCACARVCADSRVAVLKTASRGAEVLPVCMDGNLSVALLVTCEISTGEHPGGGCSLLYGDGGVDGDVLGQCDPRFSLVSVNGTVSIRLSNLTSKDSGNYTCQCSYERQTQAVHLNMTAEDDGKSIVSAIKFVAAVVIVAVAAAAGVVAVFSGIISIHVLRRSHYRSRQSSSGGCDLSRFETLQTLDQEDDYTSLQGLTSDVYQTITGTSRSGADLREHSEDRETGARESELYPIYEMISNSHGDEADVSDVVYEV